MMQKTIRPTILFGVLLSLIGCAHTLYQPGKHARIFISDNFKPSETVSIAIMPFFKNDTKYLDFSVMDRISGELIGMGFTVVERVYLESVFEELRLNMTGTLSSKRIKEIGQLMNADMIVFGNVGYDNYERTKTISARFVDVQTGEVLINSFCCNDKIGSKFVIDEMLDVLETKLVSGAF